MANTNVKKRDSLTENIEIVQMKAKIILTSRSKRKGERSKGWAKQTQGEDLYGVPWHAGTADAMSYQQTRKTSCIAWRCLGQRSHVYLSAWQCTAVRFQCGLDTDNAWWWRVVAAMMGMHNTLKIDLRRL